MSVEDLERQIEVANPQHPQVATVLLVDTSGSMAGDKIKQLNEGIRYFRDDVASNDLARKRVEVAIVAFGGDVTTEHGFSSIDDFEVPKLTADGGTPMGEAILQAISLIRARKQTYKEIGTDYYRPWIFLVTDGEPTDMKPGDDLWDRAVSAIHNGETSREFLFFGVGVEPADMETLRKICPPERPPVQLRPGRFRDMFAWLSKSHQRVSASRVGEQVPLENPTGPNGWAEIETI
jgi:uncharacterized protein YegL